MVPNKEAKIILSLVIVSALLLVSAIFTINGSFAIDKEDNKSNWSIYYSGVDLRSNVPGNVDIEDNLIDIKIEKFSSSQEFSFITKIKNDGTYDAKLEKLIITDLNLIEIGTSSLGNTYSLGDFITIDIFNASANSLNKIEVDTPVEKGDLLLKGTENMIFIKVNFKNEAELTEDMLEVLDNYDKEIDLNLSINAVYQQKK